MTIASFVIKNALRNRRRALLTIVSVAVSCALLVTLLTLQRELTTPPESEAASLRVIARNKVSLMQPLPYKQLAQIERIPGVKQVTPFTFFGGTFRDETATGWVKKEVVAVTVDVVVAVHAGRDCLMHAPPAGSDP